MSRESVPDAPASAEQVPSDSFRGGSPMPPVAFTVVATPALSSCGVTIDPCVSHVRAGTCDGATDRRPLEPSIAFVSRHGVGSTGVESTDRPTQLTTELKTGDAIAAAELLPLVYDQLYELATRHFRHQPRDHTLQPTALVHEAFLKMVKQPRAAYADQAHFCAVAAMAMRQILIDHAAKRATKKRGGAARRIELQEDHVPVITAEAWHDLVALDAALTRLAAHDTRKSRVVEMRYFGGLTMEQIACVLDISLSTAESDWRMARAWLSKEMQA